MLRIWLVVPLALSFLSLMVGLRVDFREQVSRAGGEPQILETLEFWVKHRGDRRGLNESLEILRREAGFTGLGLCYRGQKLLEVGDLRGDCGLPSENALISFSEKRLKNAGSYSLMSESQAFSSLAGLLYFGAFVLFAGFVLFGVSLSMSNPINTSSRAPRPGRSKLCAHTENQLEI